MSNHLWGGWQVEQQRMDGDGREGHNSNDEGKQEMAQRENDDEQHKGVWGAQMWRGMLTSPHHHFPQARISCQGLQLIR